MLVVELLTSKNLVKLEGIECTVCLVCNEYANYGHQQNFCCTRSFSLIFEANTRSTLWLVLYQQLPHA